MLRLSLPRPLAGRGLPVPLGRHRRALAVGFTALVLRSALAPAVPLLFGRAIDAVRDRAAPSVVTGLLAILLGAAALSAVFQFAMRRLLIGVSRDAEADLRDGLFGHILRLPIAFFDRARTGDLLTRMTGDVEAVRMALGPGAMHLAQTILTTLCALAAMLFLSPTLTAAVVLPLAALGFAMKRLLPVIGRRSLAVQEEQGRLATFAQESFAGARAIQTFAREPDEIAAFRDRGDDCRRTATALAGSRALTHVSVEALSGLVVVALLLIGGPAVIDGHVSFGTFAAFAALTNMLVWPMIALGWTLSLFQRGRVSLDRIREILALAPSVPAGTPARATAGPPPGVEIRTLAFAYGDGPPALAGIDLRIPPGSTAGIVGPTGSGKSTLAALLARLYDPPRGTVFVDGIDVLDLPIDRLRALVGIVPQDTFLFSDTLRANLLFGRPDAPAATLDQVLRDAALEDVVARLPLGLHQRVGERGVTLSGGQKQRVALARTLLTDPPILVIDDGLSAVDAATETRILEGLRRDRGRRTCIIISHRIEAVRHADTIVVLEAGRVTESGTHAGLLALGGTYGRLHRLQRLSEEIEEL